MNHQLLKDNLNLVARKMSFTICAPESECRSKIRFVLSGKTKNCPSVENAYNELFKDNPFK